MADKIDLSKLDEYIKNFASDVEKYFKSLNQTELIAWGLIGGGFLFLILGIIFI